MSLIMYNVGNFMILLNKNKNNYDALKQVGKFFGLLKISGKVPFMICEGNDDFIVVYPLLE